MVLNTAFFPSLMWNARFSSLSGDPFDNSAGSSFPRPEGRSLSYLPHLLDAQAFIPPTERTEVAGFAFPGDNDAIRAEVVRRLNAVPDYRRLFGEVVPGGAARRADHLRDVRRARSPSSSSRSRSRTRRSTATRAASGTRSTDEEKRGALLFFGQAGCVACHAVSGPSNEMFSDFREHVDRRAAARPRPSRTSPSTGPARTRTSAGSSSPATPPTATRSAPRRCATSRSQPAFMHDGAFTRLEAAIRHHLDVVASAAAYDPAGSGPRRRPRRPDRARSPRSSRGSTRSSRRRNTSRGAVRRSSRSSATACSTRVRGPSACATCAERAAERPRAAAVRVRDALGTAMGCISGRNL